MRPFPAAADYGSWDSLPDDPPQDTLDLRDGRVQEALERRDQLKQQWHDYACYPHGFWRAQGIADDPEGAEAWRNWFLRRAHEGITFINHNLRRWSSV